MDEYIESIECTISFQKDLKNAKHEYKYKLRHFGDDEGEDKFFFLVPNAQSSEIPSVMASDGDNHQPSISRVPHNSGTKLVFSNLAPVAANQAKVLTFSYEAPTDAFRHEDLINNVAFYRAELFHTYDVGQAKVTINLPSKSRILKYVGNANIDGSSITFEQRDMKKDELYAFPIFFYRRKRLIAFTAFAGTAAIGAALEVSFEYILQWFKSGN